MKLDKSTVEARQYLTGLLTTLESIKTQLADNEAIKNETIAQAHIENFAEKLFNFADKKEKTGNIDKSVVHAFYTAGHVMDVLALFGEIDEPFLSSKKYAKWKSTQIFTCLRDGTPYVPSSQQETETADDDLTQFGSQFQPNPAPSTPHGPREHNYNDQPVAPAPAPGPGLGFNGYPNFPSDQSLPNPPARSNIPPSSSHFTPSLPSHGNSSPYPPQSNYQSDFSAPQPVKSVGGQPTEEEFAEVRKFAKYAVSAIDYEDVNAIRENLLKALAVLQKY
uniref:Vacuolar protein sorting-associated protein VTA1 homolog n=1 Tax=Caenorhabditis japonica TaxID=281687 RepID=A0A8R1I0R9_CAEJA